MKHIRGINEAISGTIETNKLYVVTHGGTDISIVYASKRTAELEKKRLEKDAHTYYENNFKSNIDQHDTLKKFIERNAPKYKVQMLYDAIEDIINIIRNDVEDSFASHENPSY